MNVWSTNTDFTEVIQNIPNDRKSLDIGKVHLRIFITLLVKSL